MAKVDLSGLARDFASEITGLLNCTVTDGIRLRSVLDPVSKQQVVVGYDIHQQLTLFDRSRRMFPRLPLVPSKQALGALGLGIAWHCFALAPNRADCDAEEIHFALDGPESNAILI